MTLQTKPLAELTEADVRSLIENEVPEGKCIDYKRELPEKNTAAKKEFLFDVSSFANASGGRLIYGIEEEGGIPKEIPGLSVLDTEAEWLGLESMILDGIDPRIPGMGGRFIPVAPSKHVLVIQIPKSWNPPHMVIFSGANKFCARNSARKYLLDVTELRSIFAMSSSITEQIRKFRVDRVSRIIAEETPIAIAAGPKIILHLLPLQAFSSTARIDISKAQRLPNLKPLAEPLSSRRINLEGILYSSTGYIDRPHCGALLQLYHNGIIESVDTTILSANGRPIINAPHLIPGGLLDKELFRHASELLTCLQQLGITAPVVAGLTLLGVKGYAMAVGPRFMGGGGAPIDRDLLIIPETLIENLERPTHDLKPMIDAVWNAAGWQQSVNLDADGNYCPS